MRQRAAAAAPVASAASLTTCSAVAVSSAPAARASPKSSSEDAPGSPRAVPTLSRSKRTATPSVSCREPAEQRLAGRKPAARSIELERRGGPPSQHHRIDAHDARRRLALRHAGARPAGRRARAPPPRREPRRRGAASLGAPQRGRAKTTRRPWPRRSPAAEWATRGDDELRLRRGSHRLDQRIERSSGGSLLEQRAGRGSRGRRPRRARARARPPSCSNYGFVQRSGPLRISLRQSGESGNNHGLIGSPAPKRPPAEEPPIDPTAVPRAVAHARARRRARIEHRQELRRARVRFLVLLGVLLFVTIVLVLSIWEKIQTAFGI